MSPVAAITQIQFPPGICESSDHSVGGFSSELKRLVRNIENHLSLPVSRGRANRLVERLVEIRIGTATENWDGYNAIPIPDGVFLNSELFIRALPSPIRTPDLVPEASGDLGFEWRDSRGYVFVVSVSSSDVITYAGVLSGGRKVHGEERFVEGIPESVLQILFAHFSQKIP